MGHKFGQKMDGSRRSIRKREDKSYVEINDSMVELDNSKRRNNGPSCMKVGGSGHGTSIGGSVALSNGGVEMESEDDDDEDLPLLPLPKVRNFKNV